MRIFYAKTFSLNCHISGRDRRGITTMGIIHIVLLTYVFSAVSSSYISALKIVGLHLTRRNITYALMCGQTSGDERLVAEMHLVMDS